MSTKTEKFKETLVELSDATDYKNALLEWSMEGAFYDDSDEARCICGQPIRYVVVYGNPNTNAQIHVGSDCSDFHFGTNYDNAVWQMERKKKHDENKIIFAKELECMQIILKVGTDWEKDFALSMKKIFLNGWSMSEKQSACWDKILQKYKIKNKTQHLNDDFEIENINFSPITFLNKDKEVVQREAYQVWKNKNFKGTLEIATGVGKTFIGLMAIQQHPNDKVYIVVPKIDLQEQWIEELKTNLKIPEDSIGKVGNGFKEFNKKIVVAVVNSLRDEMITAGLLIMDEMHRYGSNENFNFLRYGMFQKILGLTATVKREDGAHKMLLQYAPLIFQFSQKQAIDDEILAKYKLFNVQVGLNPEERMIYAGAEKFIKENFPIFGNDFNIVKGSVRGGGVHASIAADLMRAFQKRRQVLLHSDGKIIKTAEIIKAEGTPKTIIFCEYIKTAERIMKTLKTELPDTPAAIYHSKMKSQDKDKMLDDFKNGACKIMVSVKSLDEGTNIPDCEMAIIVGGTSVKRQMIQRLGRILRITEDKNTAKVYQLYIPGTQDYTWMRKRLQSMTDNASEVRWL